MGTSNAGEVGRNRDFEPISGLTACVNAATGQVLSIRSPVDHGPSATVSQDDTSLVAAVLIAGEDDEMFMTRRLNVNSKLTTDRHEASRGLFAELFVLITRLVTMELHVYSSMACH